MSSWTPRRVLDAAVASEWRPDSAVEVLTDDYRLIRYPDWALDSAFPAAQVTRSHSERGAAEVIGEVAGRVRQWGRPGVAWWVSSATRPADTETALRAAGGKQIDAVQILARELDGALGRPGRPRGRKRRAGRRRARVPGRVDGRRARLGQERTRRRRTRP